MCPSACCVQSRWKSTCSENLCLLSFLIRLVDYAEKHHLRSLRPLTQMTSMSTEGNELVNINEQSRLCEMVHQHAVNFATLRFKTRLYLG